MNVVLWNEMWNYFFLHYFSVVYRQGGKKNEQTIPPSLSLLCPLSLFSNHLFFPSFNPSVILCPFADSQHPTHCACYVHTVHHHHLPWNQIVLPVESNGKWGGLDFPYQIQCIRAKDQVGQWADIYPLLVSCLVVERLLMCPHLCPYCHGLDIECISPKAYLGIANHPDMNDLLYQPFSLWQLTFV